MVNFTRTNPWTIYPKPGLYFISGFYCTWCKCSVTRVTKYNFVYHLNHPDIFCKMYEMQHMIALPPSIRDGILPQNLQKSAAPLEESGEQSGGVSTWTE